MSAFINLYPQQQSSKLEKEKNPHQIIKEKKTWNKYYMGPSRKSWSSLE